MLGEANFSHQTINKLDTSLIEQIFGSLAESPEGRSVVDRPEDSAVVH